MPSNEINPALAKMREPFAANQISKMCRSTKKDNPKGSCPKCHGYHGLPAIQLDYVGHAALTDRLLDADPEWSWKPMAFDAMGYPALDKDGGMWIWLTVGGITRPGYGDAQGKTGGDAMKERIGDALRNAAMRFGAALELWHKGELHVDDTDTMKEPPKPSSQQHNEPPKSATMGAVQQSLYDELSAYCKGDIAQMDAVCLEVTYYKSGDKEYSFGLDRLPKASEKWCNTAINKLKKKVEAETSAIEDTEDQDIPF